MDRNDEQRLVAQSREGDAGAFEELVTETIDSLYRVAYRFTGSVHDAEDVVQEAYFKAYKALGRFRGESRFQTWKPASCIP